MPRVSLNKKQYLLKDFSHWINDRMDELKLNQADAGKYIGVSQQVFSNKLKTARFSLEEVITLLHEFQATDDEIVKLLAWR